MNIDANEFLSALEYLTIAYTQRTTNLKEGITWLQTIYDNSDGYFAKYLSWERPAPRFEGQIRFDNGWQDMTKAVFGRTLPKHRVKRPTKAELQNGLYSERKQAISDAIQTLSAYCNGIELFLVNQVKTNYAAFWQRLSTIDSPVEIATEVNTPSHLADFLNKLYHLDAPLCRALLSTLPEQENIYNLCLVLRENDSHRLQQILSKASPFLALEISAWQAALYPTDIYDLDRAISLCYSVHEDFFLAPEFRLSAQNEDLLTRMTCRDWSEYAGKSSQELEQMITLITKRSGNVESSNKTSKTNQRIEKEIIAEAPPTSFIINRDFKNIKDFDVITDIVVKMGFIKDDPEQKELFKYRFTGEGNVPKDEKIVWVVNATRGDVRHAGALFGLIYAASQYGRRSDNYNRILLFFTFARKEDNDTIAFDYTPPKSPDQNVSPTLVKRIEKALNIALELPKR